jgi:hypothetical protein
MDEALAVGGAKPATTTLEEDRHSFSQRRVNIIWEGTQAFIALTVTVSFVFASLKKIDSQALNNTFFVVIGFYFGRTNHQRVGGVIVGR